MRRFSPPCTWLFLILSQDILINALNNDKLDEFKKATIALRYIGLIRGKNNVEDKYTKQLSDLNFENSFGFKWITKLN